MSRLIVAFILTASISLMVMSSYAAESVWSYKGANGPEKWSRLGPDFHACAGNQQSPVAIQSSKAFAANVPEVFLELEQFKPTVTNDGHMVSIEPLGTGGSLLYGGKTYKFGEIRLHHGSGHIVDGRQFPLEARFVHASDEGELFILGVLFLEGPANSTLQSILDNTPSSKGQKTGNQIIDPMQMIPVDNRFFRYKGSLTMPPCTENVTWHLYKQSLTASKDQIAALSRIYENNHRPVQPLNRRYILQEK
ncbi:carbonic anhydrase family protein [Sneathiella marina]|uniref:carbonic anhydrase n=1 Tax=Sneathiella marina TaxID=2950108 RepID=A0ABY4W5G4_9PROT|nr:carbonic anhydrase family protein [Sneathiella marina]USG62154.1 carbonic anhydrase family protein [Sneathiella marina]